MLDFKCLAKWKHVSENMRKRRLMGAAAARLSCESRLLAASESGRHFATEEKEGVCFSASRRRRWRRRSRRSRSRRSRRRKSRWRRRRIRRGACFSGSGLPHSNMLRAHLARAVVADSSTPKKLLPLDNSWELVWFWWDYKNQLDTILGWIRKILAREGGSTGFLFLRTSSIHRNNPSSKHLPAVVVWQHCFSIKERNYKSPAACIEKLNQLLFWTQSSLQPSVLFLASVWIINGKGFSSFNIWPHWTQARWMCVCVSIRISLLCFDVFHWGPIPPARAGWVETADVVPTLHLSLLLDS